MFFVRLPTIIFVIMIEVSWVDNSGMQLLEKEPEERTRNFMCVCVRARQ